MSSYTLNIQVEGGNISSDYRVLTADSVNYIEAAFNFDQSWDDFLKTAIFRVGELVYHIPLENNACTIPFEVLREPIMYISVFGILGSTRATTTELPIQIQNSGYAICEPSAPTPDPYNYFLERVTELKSLAEAAAEQTAIDAQDTKASRNEISSLANTAVTASGEANQSNLEAKQAALKSEQALSEIQSLSNSVAQMNSNVANNTAIAQRAATEALNTSLVQIELHNNRDNSLAHPVIREIAESAKAIALGKANSLCFETEQQLLNWVSGKYTRPDLKTVNDLKTGDNLYILELGVPDYWWDGANIQPLGAEKPEFSDYYTKNQIDARLSNASFELISKDEYYSKYENGGLDSGRIYFVFEEE